MIVFYSQFSHLWTLWSRFINIWKCWFHQIYVRAGLDRFGLTQPLTTNWSRDLLSFFNFLLSLQLLAHWFFWFKPVKTGKIRKVKDWASAETTITKSYLTKSCFYFWNIELLFQVFSWSFHGSASSCHPMSFLDEWRYLSLSSSCWWTFLTVLQQILQKLKVNYLTTRIFLQIRFWYLDLKNCRYCFWFVTK